MSEENKNIHNTLLGNGGNILVTGGSGMIGSELIQKLLAGGERVKAIYNSTPIHIEHPNLTLVKCNILDTVGLEEVMQNITQVYHCAAIVSFNPKNKRELFKINIEGTANVVNAALDAGVQRFLHVSSVAALGRIRKGQTITEEMNWTEESSNSVYGQSKYLGEMEVWRAIGEGLNAVIVNPSLILGNGDWTKGSTEIFKSAYEEFPWYAEGVTGFVDVRDVVKAMILLMKSDISSQRYILSAENVSYRTVFTEMSNCFGKKPPHKRVTKFLGEVVWRLEGIKSKFTKKDPLVTKETALTAQTKVYFDNAKVLKALPQFSFRPLTETINDTCNLLKKKYELS